MFTDYFAGARCFWRGLGLLTTPGLRRYAALPIVVNIVVFSLLIWFAAGQFDGWVKALMPDFPKWLQWLRGLAWVLFAALVVLLVYFSFTIVANLIGSPFNGMLAEAVERHLTGVSPNASGTSNALREIPTTVMDEIRKLAYSLRYVIPLLILSWLPGLNLIAPLLWALFGIWMLAVEYADYPLGNRGLRGHQVREILRKHRPAALGFGSITLFATLVPGLNLLAMPAAVAGATVLTVERLGND